MKNACKMVAAHVRRAHLRLEDANLNYVRKPSKRIFIAYLFPGVFLYSISVFLPIIYAVYYGFFKWSGGYKMTFIGLENYKNVLNDMVFWQSF